MSQTVDSKVVEMQFDNAQFERNVATSMSTLDKLKAALNFGDSAKSLKTLETAAGRVNMGGLTGAVETVSSKFSAFEIVAITALANITNSAVNAGKRLVSSLSVDNITAGWEKFGEKTQSVATLAAQGYALEEVNKQLDKLNWFTDETSYNFTDMTSNIAKFTATGQDLESSVTAMQGIANWAALSGQNAMTASRAMYQLSQAMGAGVMRKEDYKSIQNASMDTKEFRQHALDAAVALGTLQKNADGSYRSIVEGVKAEDFEIGQFADHLTKDLWFTSDVMMKVFQEYSSAVEPIYDFTEQYDLLASQVLEAKHKYDEGGDSFKDYIETLDLSKEGRKDLEDLVKNLDDFGVKALEAAQQARTWADVVDSVKDAVSTAWMKTFELIFGNQEQATKLFTSMANELYDVFAEPINGLNELLEEGLGAESVGFASEAFKKANKELDDFTGRGVLIDAFAKIWTNLLDTLDIVPEAFRQVFPEATAEQLYDAIVKFHDFAESLRLSDETADKLSKTFYGVFSAFDIVRTIVGTIADAVLPELVNGFSGLAGHVLGVTGDFGVWIGELNDSIKSSERLQTIADTMASAIRKAFEIIEGVIGIVGPLASDFIGTVKDNFVTPGFIAFSGLLDNLGQKLDGANRTASNFRDKIGGIFAGIKAKLDESGFFAALQNIWTVAKAAGKWIFESLGQGIGAIVKAVANADFKGIVDFFGSLAGVGVGVGAIGLIKELKDFIAVLKEGKGVKKENPITSLITSVKDTLEAVQDKLKPDQLRAIAVSIAILAGSVFVLSRIDGDKLASSLGAMLGVFIELMGAMYAYSKLMNGAELAGTTGAMIGMSVGILILSGALKKIADIDPDRLVNSVLALGAVMLELVAATKLLSMGKGELAKGATGMIAMAAAVKILASACKDLSDMDWNHMVQGLVGIGILLGELTVFSLYAGESKHILATGVSMIAIGVALKILASAVKSFGNLSVDQITKGLGTMAGVLAELAIAVNLMPMKILAIGPGLIAISTALIIMSGALRIMGGMSWDSIGRGLTVLGGSILILAVGVNAMSGALAGAAALTIVAGALALLTPILVVLGNLKITTIGKALLALAGVFTVLGVAGALLSPLIGTLAALAGVMALMGASVALFGVGLVAAGAGLISIAAGLTAFAAAVAAQGPLILSGIKMMLIGIVDFIPSIIGTLATSFAKGIITFVKVIADAAPELLASVVKIIGVLVDAVVTCAPQIAEGLLKLILSAFEFLATYAPQITDAAIRFLGGVLTTIGKHLSSIDLSTFTDALLGVAAIAAFMAALGALVGLVPGAMVGVLGLGVLIAELGAVFAALGMLKQIPGVEWLIDEGGDFAAKIGNAVGKFIGGIVGGVAEGAASSLPKIGSYLAEFMDNASPFFDKVDSIGYGAFDAVGGLADAIMTMTQANLLDSITGWITGSSSISTFTASLIDLATGLKVYTDIIDSANFNDEKINASKNLAEMLAAFASNDIPRTGGLIGLILGNKNLGEFGNQLGPLATGLKVYTDIIDSANFNDEKLEASTKLTQMLGGIASTNIPKTSGLFDALGEGKITSFAAQLLPLAEGLRDYAGLINTAEFSDEKIEASQHLVAMLGTLASTKIPKSGGLIGLIEGDNSLATFGKQLPALGTALANYGKNLGDDLDTSKILSSIRAIKGIAEISTTKLPAFNDEEITVLQVQLPKIAEGLKNYSTIISDAGFDDEKIEISRKLAEMLAALASVEIPGQNGVLQFIRGEQDLSVFGGQLLTLAMGLRSYSEVLNSTDFNDEKINASKNLAEMLAAFASNSIPKTGGLIGFLQGEADISSFSRNLPVLATKLTEYADNLGPSLNDTAKINSSKNIVDILSAFSKLSNGGAIDYLIGDGEFLKLAKQLPAFAKALTEYANNIGENLDSENVNASFKLAEKLGDIQNTIASKSGGGVFSSGELEKFGKNIVAFAQSLSQYCNLVNLTDPDAVKEKSEGFVEAINTLAIADFDTISTFAKSLNEGADDIAKASQELTNAFADGLKLVETDEIADSGKNLVQALSTAITDNSGSLESAVDSLLLSFENSISEQSSVLNDKMLSIVSALITSISSKQRNFVTEGGALMKKLSSGVSNNARLLKDSFSKAILKAKDKVRGYYSDFKSAGKYLVEGFAKGIDENTYKAKARAKAMANAAYQAAKNELKEKSPSRKMYEIGAYAVEGFSNALKDGAKIAYKSSVLVGRQAQLGLNRAVYEMHDILTNKKWAEPTIRPVMDLDDVRLGASAIGNFFDRAYAVNVSETIGMIGNMTYERNHRSSNNDLMGAIEKLGRTISDVPRNTYIIDGITYDDGSNVSSAIGALIRAAKVGGRA